MKSENKITKENVEELDSEIAELVCEEHLASCKRFLEFLESTECCISCDECRERTYKEITDLEQAIKTYEDAGIK